MFNLRHLKTLTALREKDSLQAAAEGLYLTQSALSHQIRDLESQLSAQLYVRSTHPVRFTPVGNRLLRLADQVLPLMDEAHHDLQRIIEGAPQRLLMAIECHSCFDWMIRAMANFRQRHMQVDMDLRGGVNFDALPVLAKGDLDLVITSDPVAIDRLHYQPLFRYQAVLIVGLDSALANADWVRPEDLTTETLIAYPIEQSRMDIFNLFLREAGISPAYVRRAELTPVIVQQVAAGNGVACLPAWVADEYVQEKMVKALPLGPDGCWNTMHAAVLRSQLEVDFVQDFLATMEKVALKLLPKVQRCAPLASVGGAARGVGG